MYTRPGSSADLHKLSVLPLRNNFSPLRNRRLSNKIVEDSGWRTKPTWYVHATRHVPPNSPVSESIEDQPRIEEARLDEHHRPSSSLSASGAGAQSLPRRRWAFLAEASRLLSQSLDYETTLETVARLPLPQLGAWCIVDVCEPGGTVRRVAVVHPDSEKQALARKLKSGWPPRRDDPLGVPAVAQTGESEVISVVTKEVLVAVARNEENLRILQELGIGSVMTVPLCVRGQILGAITFVIGRAGHQYTGEDLALAEDLAARCALAVENARLYRQLQESIRLRDQVLGYVSHDLKNPLSIITLSASQVFEGMLDKVRQTEEARTILSATQQMQRLIGDLLEVATLEAGGLTIAKQRIEPATMLAEIALFYHPTAAAHLCELGTQIPAKLPAILGDPGRLRQVFANLLENAFKFTAAGDRITIGAISEDDSVVFFLADTGSGIPEADLPHLFHRFWQARRARPGSAGLGLTICKGIVEAHGGEIWAEISENRGSTFRFRIPTA